MKNNYTLPLDKYVNSPMNITNRKVEKSPINNAIIRTTTSITQFHSGIKVYLFHIYFIYIYIYIYIYIKLHT